MRFTFSLLVLLGLLFSSPGIAEATSTSGYCIAPHEAEMLRLVNDYRAQHGLSKLVFTPQLGASAEHHSAEMAKYDYFSHTLRNGVTWSQNMRNHGYTRNTYRGENIAAGSSTAANTFLQWKNSPGHNANMLNPNYRAIGIGRKIGPDSTYRYYWTQNFGGYVDGYARAC